MVSREMGSRPRWVILTVRKAVFIWGETEVIVPWMIVPSSLLVAASRNQFREQLTILELNRDGFVRAFHQESTRSRESVLEVWIEALRKRAQLVP